VPVPVPVELDRPLTLVYQLETKISIYIKGKHVTHDAEHESWFWWRGEKGQDGAERESVPWLPWWPWLSSFLVAAYLHADTEAS